MKIAPQNHEILWKHKIKQDDPLFRIEQIARTCYQSTPKDPSLETTKNFVRNIIKNGHEAMLEHYSFSVKFITNRAIANEITRHRVGVAFAQESTRWVNYKNSGMEFIQPQYTKNNEVYLNAWKSHMEECEKQYCDALYYGELNRDNLKPQDFRGLLPLDLKTELVMTANLREWRYFLKLRTAPDVHPQLRELTLPLLKELQQLIPVIFDDIGVVML